MIVQRIPCDSNTGLGCPGCGGTCGQWTRGLGLFETGVDISGWTFKEWLVVGAAVVTVAIFAYPIPKSEYDDQGYRRRGVKYRRRNPRRRRR